MKIIIGSDHRGFELKQAIITNNFDDLEQITWDDVGTENKERVDYPVFAKRVCKKVISQDKALGIIICGSGIGVSIAANRFPGIYAALCWTEAVARVARQHDKANVLVLPADFLTHQEAFLIINAWLQADFLGGRYQERLDLLEQARID